MTHGEIRMSLDVKTPPLHGPWPEVSVWGNRWAGPGRPAAPAKVVALAVAAAVAAVSLPLDRGGIGWLVTALAGVGALTVAGMMPLRPPGALPAPLVRADDRFRPAQAGWTAATVALLGVGTVRAAGWLVVLCVLTAVVTGTLAATGGRSLRAMALAQLMSPVAGMRATGWFVRGVAGLPRPGGGARSGFRVAATVGVSVVLLVVFGALFASADRTFADLIVRVTPRLDALSVVRWVFVFLVAGYVLGGVAYLRAAPPRLSGLDGSDHRTVRRLEWAIPLGLLVLLFASFVAVQLAVLFGGSRRVLSTAGLTYADYARSGFWQLLVVTGLSLGVLAAAARWAPRTTAADRTLIRVVLGALAALTLVIVASAVHRMDLYGDTYGLTRLRVLVELCEVWLGVVFVLVPIAGIKLRAAWLPQVAAALAVLALLGLAAANPDGRIADRNIDRYRQTHRIDIDYLSGLSADAVPALMGLPEPERDCALGAINRELTDDADDWRGFSYGRAHARELLSAHPGHQYLCRP
jgi:hypothetical protein